MRMIGVLDYGIGNIGSILNMLKKVGVKAQPVTTGEALSTCDRLILPGVGAFDQGMALLNQSGMRGALDEAWLQKQLKIQKINDCRDVFFASVDRDDQLSVYLRETDGRSKEHYA